ncbi:hypothetical protein BBBOND_0308460 [Babesia bigemina]|uniref:Uncharacterized protein n=1 Tax=Babesia bigemina TaxID=5866 RepID=A0A061DAD9_BABBI|nr:hypothetical protein BBBOND_0308460 [Babesia bigemina]CDR96942.1 hypothetical protein BBBOND_0308460 [Babesia bigemina]|eukprot:XP_012769128.1 hypothetical protein BBBOND_0308460 [Babesia bigemina]
MRCNTFKECVKIIVTGFFRFLKLLNFSHFMLTADVRLGRIENLEKRTDISCISLVNSLCYQFFQSFGQLLKTITISTTPHLYQPVDGLPEVLRAVKSRDHDVIDRMELHMQFEAADPDSCENAVSAS